MAYELDISDVCEEAIRKHGKKNAELKTALEKKIRQILENPHHFKPLRNPLQNKRRVQLGSFVLIYEIEEQTRTVKLLKFSHHDDAY
ncbi:type II toxin-antitoxin system RelE/ParE family toxin [Candidatus Micrarchaeota archaeon]|nr:type II toxin-antitoxin system RelE/ParE family toxin [Candidatus Micrarchaeota archaeon]